MVKIEQLKYLDALNGTSFFGGMVLACANDLEEKLGVKPELGGDKVTFEFDLQLEDGTPFSLYDWKEYQIGRNTQVYYHIGSRNREDTGKVCHALRDYGFIVKY